MTELCDLPAVEARRLIGLRALSPVELLDSCLARVAAVNPAVNAVVAIDEAGARAGAAEAEAAVMEGRPLGPLHGLPVGVKDLEEVAGLRTTYGSPLHRDHVPDADHPMVAGLRRAGAVILAKTNVPEFGAGANTRNVVYGATGNPFDPVLSAAGSSGGSAAALATGMVALATGSDLGGSLRNPAAFCGVVGFRPSPGLVPDPRRGLGWSPLPVLGPMARTVADAALLLSVQAVPDDGDPLSRAPDGPVFPALPADLASLRCAVSADLGFAPTSRAVRDAFAPRAAAMGRLFGRVTEAHPDCAGADEAFEVLRAGGFLSAHLGRVIATPEQVGVNVRANVGEGLRYALEDHVRAAGLQTDLYRRFQAFFREHDLLVTPAMTLSPRPWRELYPAEIDGVATRSYFHWLALSYAVTLVGHPALCLPLGLDPAGMPFGVQVVGPRGGDALVLRAGAAIEAALADDPALCRPVPDLAALRDASPIAAMPGFLDAE